MITIIISDHINLQFYVIKFNGMDQGMKCKADASIDGKVDKYFEKKKTIYR